jgi:hypothetical protein
MKIDTFSYFIGMTVGILICTMIVGLMGNPVDNYKECLASGATEQYCYENV